MTTQEGAIRRKLTLLELAECLQKICLARKIHGVSFQHFYNIPKTYEEHGLEGLMEIIRRKSCAKNRLVAEADKAVLKMAYIYPPYGQVWGSNELRKTGVLISWDGVGAFNSATG